MGSTSMNDNHKDKSNNKIKKKYKEKEKNEIIDENKDEDENSMTNLEEGYESQLVGFLDDVELCQIYDKKVVSSSNLTTTDLLNVHPFASREWERWDGGKVGGKPVWLNPENLPNPTETLICKSCRKPMVFLLQLYAPINDIPSAFHRALYLYCCRSLACTRNSNLICLRTQFPRENKYLPLNSEDGVGKMIYQPEIFNQNLSVVCGNLGSQRCSGCKKVYYCTREHQLEDWKLGHKSICQSMSSTFSSALSCPCSPSSSSRLSSIDDNENQTKPDRIEGEREEKGKDKGKDKDKDYQQQQKQHHDQQQQQQESLIRIVAEKQKQEVEGKPV